MAARSEQSLTEHGDVSAYLMDSTLDEYVAVCAAVAQSIGFRAEEHEISKKMVILKGKLGGKRCTVVSPVPSLRVPAATLNSVMRSAARGGGRVILLSVFNDGPPALKSGSAVTCKTGGEFLNAARRTAAFRRIRNRMEKGEEGTRGRDERKYHDLMKYARERYDAGDLEEALSTVTAVLGVEPLSDEAFRLEGNIKLKKEQYDQALLSFDSAIRLKPDSVDNWFGKANALYMLGRYEEELRCYDAILRLKPGHRGALQNKGATLQHLGRLKEAMAAYERVLKLKKNDKGVMKNLAIAKYTLGDTEGALRIIDSILSLEKDEPRALRMKGLILAEQGNEEALDYLIKYSSSEKDENVIAVINALRKNSGSRSAVQAVQVQEPDEHEPAAVAVVDAPATYLVEEHVPVPAVIAENRELPGAEVVTERMEKAGMLSGERGMLDAICLLRNLGTPETRAAASVILTRLSGMARGELVSHEVLSLAEQSSFDEGDYDRAEKMARRLSALSPSHAGSTRLAADLAFLGRYEEAITALGDRDGQLNSAAKCSLLLMEWKPGKALKIIGRQEHAELLFSANRGMVQMEKRGPASALDYFSATASRNASVENNEGVCLLLEGDTKRSLEVLRKSASSGRWQPLFNLGAALLESGSYVEAAEMLRKSIAKHDSGVARNSMGIALAELHDYDGARREFEAALAARPPCAVARRNLKKLMRRTGAA